MAVSSHSKEIFKGTFWSLAGFAAVRLISFFYVIIVARLASVDDVGTFYLALSIVGVLALFTDLGMSSSFVRYVPYLAGQGAGRKLARLVRVTYMVVGALGAVMSAAVYLCADILAGYFQNPALAVALRITAPYLLINAMFGLNLSYLQARKNLRDQSFLASFQNGTKLFVTLVLFFALGATLVSISAGYLLSFFFALALSVFYMRKPFSEIPATGADAGYGGLLAEVVPFGITMSLISSFWMLINYSDRILLGYLLDPSAAAAQVGIYSVATSMSLLIMIFPGAVGSIFFPVASELLGQGKSNAVAEICETSLRWTLFITFPLALVMIAFPDDLLSMFYGGAYTAGGLAMAIFAIGLLVRSLTYMQSLVLASMRLLRIELKIALAAALLNLALNVILIPQYGMNGSAFASAVSLLLVSVLFVHYSKKLIGFHFPAESVKALLAGLFALMLLLLAKPYVEQGMGLMPSFGDSGSIEAKALRLIVLAALFAIACGIYVALLFALRSFNREDIHFAEMALMRARLPQGWVSGLASILGKGVHS